MVQRILFAAAACALVWLPAAAQGDAGLPPLPPSPYELVTSGTQLLGTPQLRARAMGLLELAIQDYTFTEPAHPDTVLASSFQSSGTAADEGSGTLEHIWIGPRRYWYAQFGDVQNNNTTASIDSTPIPLPVLLAHLIQIAPVDRAPSMKEVRAAAAQLDGTPVTCVLVNEARVPATAAGRGWLESEYCMDAAGLLRYASPVPGLYVRFDYSNPLQYAGHTIASHIRVIEDSGAQISLHIDRFGAPNGDDQQTLDAVTVPVGGTGRFHVLVRTIPVQANVDSVVIVLGVIDSHGKVVAEDLPGAATANSQTALQQLQKFHAPAPPGVQRLVYACFEF